MRVYSRLDPVWLVVGLLVLALLVSGVVVGLAVHDLQTPAPHVVGG